MAAQDEKSAANPLTARDMELLVAALQSTKEAFSIDYGKFAERSGLKNANSARVAWSGLKKKLDKLGGEGVIGGAGGASKRRADADEEPQAEGEHAEVETKSPKKKAKSTGKKAAGSKAIKDEVTDDEA